MYIYIYMYVYICIYMHEIKKAMRVTGYHNKKFVAPHALRHLIRKCTNCHKAISVDTDIANGFPNFIYFLRSYCLCQIKSLCIPC